ncbi:MAG: preprotein translocase subunit YajC [Bordetella sp. SCN 67-23]|nr:preprotein translocase subunit YajC [Burkholderiales bacterium]ODS72288.1 MAG: preprotein translocase subunit YajC [Bordetella sp. SCN 67-23]ODU80017.1 MAG: preprotein translocase subunit YajC [Bordetella sp. SCN 68-11]OJW88913.1 MAG: preprotein translocase subunit YajC [Burkholderiales bacterium 67-32]
MLTSNALANVLAQAPAAGGEGALMGMLPIVLMFVILYFLMIRPQMKRQKEHKNMVAALAKGDEVVTSGGILGKVVQVNDTYVSVEISREGDKAVEVLVQKTAVQTVLPKGTIKAL